MEFSGMDYIDQECSRGIRRGSPDQQTSGTPGRVVPGACAREGARYGVHCDRVDDLLCGSGTGGW